MLDGRRKSMQPMAGRLGVDHQRLQQFMTSSTWPVADVRARLAWRAVAVVRPEVWVVDDTGFPKDGTASPGVARQYSGTLGKVGNCQIGVSVHAASDTASCPLSWRLFLPSAWDGPQAAARRAACRIPDSEHHRAKWQLALEMCSTSCPRSACGPPHWSPTPATARTPTSVTAWKAGVWPTSCR
nr:transposase [Streptomyces avidinii]